MFVFNNHSIMYCFVNIDINIIFRMMNVVFAASPSGSRGSRAGVTFIFCISLCCTWK